MNSKYCLPLRERGRFQVRPSFLRWTSNSKSNIQELEFWTQTYSINGAKCVLVSPSVIAIVPQLNLSFPFEICWKLGVGVIFRCFCIMKSICKILQLETESHETRCNRAIESSKLSRTHVFVCFCCFRVAYVFSEGLLTCTDVPDWLFWHVSGTKTYCRRILRHESFASSDFCRETRSPPSRRGWPRAWKRYACGVLTSTYLFFG